MSAPSIYVVVFNNSDNEIMVRMTTEAPDGVNIILSHDDFTIQAGEQQKVFIGVEVAQEVTPGEYEISITAESYKEGVGGIQLMGAAGQSATLLVVSESASVMAQTVDPEGEPVTAVIRLFKVVAGQNYEFAYSDTGTLEAIVSPGSFIAQAYVGGQKLAEESFDVAADEEKTVTLTVGTIYFAPLGVVPNYDAETAELAFARIVSTLKNLYQPVANAEVILLVTCDGAPLDVGSEPLMYDYTPPDGWLDGTYGFQASVEIGWRA